MKMQVSLKIKGNIVLLFELKRTKALQLLWFKTYERHLCVC